MSRCPSASWPSRSRGERGQACHPAGPASTAFWREKKELRGKFRLFIKHAVQLGHNDQRYVRRNIGETPVKHEGGSIVLRGCFAGKKEQVH